MKLITVARFDNPVKAHLDLTKLEDEGVEASLIGVDGFRSSHSGNADIQLLVWNEDYDRALGILDHEVDRSSSTLDEVSLQFIAWFLVGPIVGCSFFVSRILFSLILPEMAVSQNLIFVGIGSLAGLVAAYSFAPKYKKVTALLAFSICFLAAWNLQ
jgi:hypothetical protein